MKDSYSHFHEGFFEDLRSGVMFYEGHSVLCSYFREEKRNHAPPLELAAGGAQSAVLRQPPHQRKRKDGNILRQRIESLRKISIRSTDKKGGGPKRMGPAFGMYYKERFSVICDARRRGGHGPPCRACRI